MKCSTADHEHLSATHEVFIDDGEPPDWYPYCELCTDDLITLYDSSRPLYKRANDESITQRVERLEQRLGQAVEAILELNVRVDELEMLVELLQDDHGH